MPNSTRRSRYVWIAAVVLFLGCLVAAGSISQIRWRLVVLQLKVTGSLPDVGWKDLMWMSRPGRHFNLQDLATTPNPYAVIKSPYDSASDVAVGAQMFRARCADCHGSDGSGGPGGPSLQQRQMSKGGSDWAIFRTISFGIPGTAMPASILPALDKWQLVAYVKSLVQMPKGGAGPATQSSIPAPESVTYEQIRDAGQTPDRWLTYSGTYDGHRFSGNTQITTSNVSGLRLLWMRQYSISEPSIETTPLVVDKYMFVTLPPNRVEALDAKTGALIWAYDRILPQHLSLCCGYQNRGLAVLNDTLFLGTLDAHLVALDIKTGQVRWDVEIADAKTGYSITGAPLALKNLVITGIAGGEFGIRGFIDARDAATGNEVWRFYTVPEPGQPGADTWPTNAWKTGGGPTWVTGSFDPETNVIYWPTGNPSPNYNGDTRGGDNLYTNSVVALDADHGTLRWYFQFSPHDQFDWDATEILVLLDQIVSGKRQPLLAQGNRNGFYYLLDGDTGQFRLAQPFAKVNWATGIDSRGRPVRDPAAHPTKEGTAIYPGVGGATNWQSPSYSPVSGLMYISALDWGGLFFRDDDAEYRPGQLFTGGSFQYFTDVHPEGTVRAVEPLTGKTRWEYRNPAFSIGGLLSTKGGVVFGSQEQLFFALDAGNGRELWRINTGGRTVAAPISFLSDGRQMVTIAAGHDLLTFGL